MQPNQKERPASRSYLTDLMQRPGLVSSMESGNNDGRFTSNLPPRETRIGRRFPRIMRSVTSAASIDQVRCYHRKIASDRFQLLSESRRNPTVAFNSFTTPGQSQEIRDPERHSLPKIKPRRVQGRRNRITEISSLSISSRSLVSPRSRYPAKSSSRTPNSKISQGCAKWSICDEMSVDDHVAT